MVENYKYLRNVTVFFSLTYFLTFLYSRQWSWKNAQVLYKEFITEKVLYRVVEKNVHFGHSPHARERVTCWWTVVEDKADPPPPASCRSAFRRPPCFLVVFTLITRSTVTSFVFSVNDKERVLDNRITLNEMLTKVEHSSSCYEISNTTWNDIEVVYIIDNKNKRPSAIWKRLKLA